MVTEREADDAKRCLDRMSAEYETEFRGRRLKLARRASDKRQNWLPTLGIWLAGVAVVSIGWLFVKPLLVPATVQPPTCRIKGNINADGEKMFHVPGSRSYDATKIDTRKGERWFCSEDDARGNGWRAPRQQ